MRSLQILYIFVLRAEKVTIFDWVGTQAKIVAKLVTFSPRNTNIDKILKLRRAIFSVFYNISSPNFAVLLILGSFF